MALKNFLFLFLLCFFTYQPLKSLSPEKISYVKNRVSKLLEGVETDSLVIQECRHSLLEDTSNAVKVRACATLMGMLKIYKKGSLARYDEHINQVISEDHRVTQQHIKNFFEQQTDTLWNMIEQEIKETQKTKSRTTLYERLYEAFRDNRYEESVLHFSIIKKSMIENHFKSVKFLVEVLCEELNNPERIPDEQAKVIEFFRKFDAP